MSLDGFIAGSDDSMDWVSRYAGPNPVAEEVVTTIGAVLAGRRSYDIGTREGAELYGGAWSGLQFVLRHALPPGPKDQRVTFLTGDLRSAVATAREAVARKYLLIIGANLAQQCIAEGLVDEILVQLVPHLLGDGVRLFGRSGAGSIDFETISVTQAGQVTNLRFEVVRAHAPPSE
jgi:dihydrofolate reductase